MPDAVIFGQHDPLSEKTLQPYAYGYNNPIRFKDPTGLSGTDWVHNRETNQIYWNNNAVSQATAGANETYLGKSGTYTTESGSTTALNSDGSHTNNSLIGGLGIANNLDPLIQAGDAAPLMSTLAFGNSNDPNAATIGPIPDSRGKTEIQMLVAENPLVQGAVGGLFMGGTGSAIRSILARGAATTSETGAYSVYQGLDASGNIRYAGITSRNPAARFAEHAAAGGERGLLDFRAVSSGLTKAEARVMEQNLINQWGLQKNGGQLLNKINSISPSKWGNYSGIIPKSAY